MNKVLYIHGMYSNAQSRKYILLKEHFPSLDWDIMEWGVDEDLQVALDEVHQKYKEMKSLIIIGDSAGGNLTVQLKMRRTQNGLTTVMILLNPLLRIQYRIADFEFPARLKAYFYEVKDEDIQQSYCLLSYQDELINHGWIKALTGLHQIWVEDDHRFLNFSSWIPILGNWLNNVKDL